MRWRRALQMGSCFYLGLGSIQPSQLYISRVKLVRVQRTWRPPRLETLAPIPVVLLDGIVTSTDGHTRALAAYREGVSGVPVYWDEDALDLEAYRICVGWCREAGIHTLRDLEGRLLAETDYQTLWLGRCQEMQATLASTRE